MSACQLQRAEGWTLIVSAKAQGIWEHRRLLRPTTEAAFFQPFQHTGTDHV